MKLFLKFVKGDSKISTINRWSTLDNYHNFTVTNTACNRAAFDWFWLYLHVYEQVVGLLLYVSCWSIIFNCIKSDTAPQLQYECWNGMFNLLKWISSFMLDMVLIQLSKFFIFEKISCCTRFYSYRWTKHYTLVAWEYLRWDYCNYSWRILNDFMILICHCTLFGLVKKSTYCTILWEGPQFWLIWPQTFTML